MKSIKFFAATTVLTLTSFASLAAEPVSQQQAQNLTEVGVVSAGGVTTLSSLEATLAAKAAAQGASGYRIVAAGGNNMLHGNAVTYK